MLSSTSTNKDLAYYTRPSLRICFAPQARALGRWQHELVLLAIHTFRAYCVDMLYHSFLRDSLSLHCRKNLAGLCPLHLAISQGFAHCLWRFESVFDAASSWRYYTHPQRTINPISTTLAHSHDVIPLVIIMASFAFSILLPLRPTLEPHRMFWQDYWRIPTHTAAHVLSSASTIVVRA